MSSAWIDRLFGRFEAFYGAKLADAWKGSNLTMVKGVWAEELAGYSGAEIKRGLDVCKAKDWPPTLPEFLKACRPPLDLEAVFLLAVEQMRLRERGEDQWPSAQVYWAATKLGRDLQQSPYTALKGRWQAAMDAALRQIQAGELPNTVPARAVALPEPGNATATPEKVERVVSDLKARLEFKPDHLDWARKVMLRCDTDEPMPWMSVQKAKQALGLVAAA